MRILHTSDWHLNDKLGHHERQPDLRRRMEEIAAILRDEAVDVMIIAGDLFSDRVARLSELRQALLDFRDVFRPFLKEGGTVAAISGNHDSEDLFELLRLTQDLTASPIAQQVQRPGRLYLVAQPMVLQLQGRGGQRVQVALQPYPTPSFYLKGKDEPVNLGLEERNLRLRDRAAAYLRTQVQQCASQPLPSVLVAHAHVRNSELSHSLYKIEERDDVVFDPGLLPPSFAYVALGHIHRAQRIDGSDHVRYSGSIERMDAAERQDDKGVVLVEITQEGARPPRVLPLDATPILDEVIDGPAGLAALQERYPASQRERPYLRYRLRCRAQDEHALHRDVRRLFPRWYKAEVEHSDGRETMAAALVSSQRLQDRAGTARGFVAERLRDHPDRDDALRLLDEVLAMDADSEEVRP